MKDKFMPVNERRAFYLDKTQIYFDGMAILGKPTNFIAPILSLIPTFSLALIAIFAAFTPDPTPDP